jgi:hypothetical protein
MIEKESSMSGMKYVGKVFKVYSLKNHGNPFEAPSKDWRFQGKFVGQTTREIACRLASWGVSLKVVETEDTAVSLQPYGAI